LHEDNQAVVAMVHSLTSRSPALMAELRLLVAVLDSHDISLRARYIRSADNWDADHYSRIVQPREYWLSPAAFETVSEWFPACSVDAFASCASALLPRFWSETQDQDAVAIDAFAQDWSAERLVWAHPPPSLLPMVLQLLRAQPSAAALVCAPSWPGSPWFRDLAEMATSVAYLPPGSLARVAFDAPARLESWGVAIFHVEPR